MLRGAGRGLLRPLLALPAAAALWRAVALDMVAGPWTALGPVRAGRAATLAADVTADARRRTGVLRLRLGLRLGLRVALRRGLAPLATVGVIAVLRHRRPARAGEQENGERGGEFRLHG